VIVGAGPTGLGAGWELKKLNYPSFKIFEQHNYVGGLAASFKDAQGFTWDIGGHVLFSHYKYFDDLFEKALNSQYVEHERNSWVWIYDRFVPYPFQNNIHRLPKEILLECLVKIIDTIGKNPREAKNFEDWLKATFGEGIFKHFLKPYNDKVWAYPLNLISKDWTAERVSPIKISKVLENVIYDKDDISWGPNNKFKFPLRGGTGAIWEGSAGFVKDHLILNKKLTKILWKEKKAVFNDAELESYDFLISSIPLNELVSILSPSVEELLTRSKELAFVSGLIVGVGFNKPCPSDKCWMYFPMPNSPFYRVTYFSNYSPNNTPDPNNNYSLMAEISYSSFREYDITKAIDETIEGMINSKLIDEEDSKKIISTHLIDVKYSYPVPTLNRDQVLGEIIPWLESNNIFSRGRFGLWKYEIGNMDHSVMQGAELVRRLLSNTPETTIFQISIR